MSPRTPSRRASSLPPPRLSLRLLRSAAPEPREPQLRRQIHRSVPSPPISSSSPTRRAAARLCLHRLLLHLLHAHHGSDGSARISRHELVCLLHSGSSEGGALVPGEPRGTPSRRRPDPARRRGAGLLAARFSGGGGGGGGGPDPILEFAERAFCSSSFLLDLTSVKLCKSQPLIASCSSLDSCDKEQEEQL